MQDPDTGRVQDREELGGDALSLVAQVAAGVLIAVQFCRGEAIVPMYVTPECLEDPNAMAEFGHDVASAFKRWEIKHGGFAGKDLQPGEA